LIQGVIADRIGFTMPSFSPSSVSCTSCSMLYQERSPNKRGREDRDSVVAGAKASRNKARVVRGILTRQLCVYYTAKHEKGLHPTSAAELDRSRAPYCFEGNSGSLCHRYNTSVCRVKSYRPGRAIRKAFAAAIWPCIAPTHGAWTE
jgi:hypothetical protein